jgi:alpha-beta hydrolase superfamily lysophospholipase
MSVGTISGTTWVVLDQKGHVVLMCHGAAAAEVADEWRQRGYRVEAVDSRQLELLDKG